MDIFPSLIASNLLKLSDTIQTLNTKCDGYHIDVMDDHFVPNLTWGPDFVSAIIAATNLSLNIHLMVDNPKEWVNRLNLRKQDFFVFHIEALDFSEIKTFIKDIKKIGCKVGIALNPETDVNLLFEYLDILDTILVMSVKPGFSGQKFDSSVLSKIEILNKEKKDKNLSFSISMDGGIDQDNIQELQNLGVDQVAVGSAIFYQEDYLQALKNLYNKIAS
ncbi:ribulose-phosphate 3-epimerase [Candidatus Babeliales bacterium]|nr:ribulose-phosphate 3-epimerase [Candidatus Babeliales bacterium]MCF7899529.1 ribulose-phosphate 3-epimerase [Candidatus Babeliales bacterium]